MLFKKKTVDNNYYELFWNDDSVDAKYIVSNNPFKHKSQCTCNYDKLSNELNHNNAYTLMDDNEGFITEFTKTLSEWSNELDVLYNYEYRGHDEEVLG